MSWAEEDWTVGLSGRVLQKVKELQILKDRLSRESKQKQLQLDNIHISLDKQTLKYEEMRGELQSVQRELQRVQNEAKAALTCRERLTQELQTKQAQVCSLEGQLDAAHTLNNKLTQEVKRLEAELEKLQNSSRSADTTLFSTPCWNTPSPWEHNGSRKEERGHRNEGQSRVSHSRQRLQFSDVATPSPPQQQHKNSPCRHPSNQSDSFSTPSAVFPWERDDSRPVTRRQSPSSPQMPCADDTRHVQSEQRCSEKEKDYRTDKNSSSSALLSRVSALEEELRVKAETLKSTQSEMVQIKKDFAAKELSVQKAQNELSLANTRVAKESERASGAEQRQKQLQEELRCQRQNAESSRLQYQQRSKDQEKEHQRDIAELQKERQCLEKQHQLEVNKLNQELQQARTLHNALQAQADKLSIQKQQLDKELDAHKDKVKWTEGQLQQSQKKEAQTQAKLTEAVREAERVAVCLEQSRKKESALEKEGKRLAEERADALRLVKELQEQQAAPASLVHPVPFCPVGQSFSPQTSYSLNARLSTRIKSTAAPLSDQKREENVDKRRVEITASYPSEREPGEGMDSEQITLISPDSEGLQRRGHRRKINEEENKSENEATDSDSSGTNKHSTFDHALSTSSHSAADTPTKASIDGDGGNLMHSAEKAPSLKSEKAKTSEDLRRENDTLRSELRDVREELQKRLDDLEAQRRAEAEARTRLKQLSRKHACQSVEKEEQDKEWRAQLEKEKAETERLRKAMAALETEVKRGREARERNERAEQEEEKNKLLEDQESEMIELNIQLKKQLAEVKAQLTLEREERKREDEERNHMTNTDMDLKKELSEKLQELEAELEVLKCSRKDSLEEEKLSVASSPLSYLTLHDNELNSNDSSLLPSPEQHLLLCESTNQRNMLESRATADLIQEGGKVIEPEHSPHVASDHDDSRQDYLVGSSRSGKELSDVQKDEAAPSGFEKEVNRLQKENVKQTERANQYQGKLEALQSQVTLQAQQLTVAFEKQSRHIAGLLAELQEKESALVSQGEELQHYKQELSALKDQKEKDEKKRGDEMMIKEVEDGEQKEKAEKEGSMEISGLQLYQEKECALTFLNTKSPADGDSTAKRDARPEIVTPASEESTHIRDNEALCSVEQHPDSVDSVETRRHHDTEESQDRGIANVAEPLPFQQLDQQLKQRIPALTISNTSGPVLHAENEHAVKQSENTGNVYLPCSAEPRSPGAPRAMSTEAQPSPLQSEKKSQGGDLAKEDRSTEEELGQQVVELNMIIRALHEEIKQQTTELAVWRLASQPAPTFDLPDTDEQSESHDRSHEGVQKSSCNVTVIREDELFLSCSSNKLQGHMLSSRLQHSNVPESKSLPPSNKTTAALQKNNQKDSEKENQEIILSHPSESCQSQHKEKRDSEVIQMSPEKMYQPHVGNDSHTISGIKQTKASKRHVGTPEAKSDASSQTTEIHTTEDSSDVWIEMKTVSSQTEESLYPGSAPKESVPIHCSSTQTEEAEDEGEPVEPPPTSSAPLTEEADSEDAMLFSGTFPIPADPARLAERIRRNRTQLSAAFDDTEYEPYGLPEVVMKGFADIPSGPSCPYIVRRGLLGTAVVPVPQKNKEQEETD